MVQGILHSSHLTGSIRPASLRLHQSDWVSLEALALRRFGRLTGRCHFPLLNAQCSRSGITRSTSRARLGTKNGPRKIRPIEVRLNTRAYRDRRVMMSRTQRPSSGRGLLSRSGRFTPSRMAIE
ncbi:hypothetical protein Adt_21028 [Abeliophyllum distichum]|uniref:Uncharacterized protein n=1 Tax=Abeliophyllum distichum TaxID=126358 RepID=A0ABD1SY66_9LAMI